MSGQEPAITVVSGDPDPVELAAVVAVLARGRTSGVPTATPKRSLWASRSRQVRPSLGAGPGSWRASTLPR